MALTYLPTAQTQQPSQQGQGYSDASIKMLRDYATALKQEQESKNPYYTWANGLADVTKNLYGDHYLRQANALERGTLNTRGTSLGSGGISGQPQTPAAAGGADAAAPFPQGSQVGSVPSGGKDSNSQPTRTAMLEGEGNTEAPATAAMRLSSKGETGKDGMAALFNISKDTGGSKSYGPLGLNSKTGSAASFAKDHPELGLTAEPGTPEFDAQWRKTAATRSDDLQGAHTDWHQKNIMRGLTESMVKAGVNPAIATDPRVQTYMADRKVQMGQAGLAHALAYAKEAGSPEDFLKSVHQVDKARTPFNFPTYLKDNPNNIQGLHNRDDLRLTTALSGADPDLAKKMVDFHKNTQLAQNGLGLPQGVGQNTPLPQGQLQGEMGQLVRNLMVGGQMTAPQAMEAAEQALKMRELTMPQYKVDEYGRAIREAPGEIPKVLPGVQPGYFGSFKEEPDMGGAGIRTYINPNTGFPERRYDVPVPPLPPGQPPPGFTAPRPQSNVTPQTAPQSPVMPGPGIAAPTVRTAAQPAAPVPVPRPASAATPAPTGGPLAVAPPSALPKGQLASAEPTSNLMVEAANQIIGKPTKFDKVAQIENAPDISEPKTPIEQKAKEALDWAEANPTSPPKMPPIVGPALQSGNIDELANIKSNRKAHEEALADQIKEQSKEYGKYQSSLRDASTQSLKLAPGLKTAVKLLDSPDFQSGPANEVIGLGRGLREELGRLAKGLADDAVKRGEDPGFYKTTADWALNPENKTATANQIYTKLLSGTVLQSLRGMLGPNAGQFRVQELKMLEQAFGNPNLTLPANKAVMGMIDKINDRNILLGQMATQYARKHHGLDPSFEEAVNRFEASNPPYTPQEYYETLKLVNEPASSSGAGGLIGTSPPTTTPSRRVFNPDTRKFE